jgi:uncharacterized protein involved in exopolysaccharide biosynthesis
VDQGRDKKKPLSASYRDTFRRHRKLFCMPVILGAVVAGIFQFALGQSYKSTASLWIDTTPPAQSSLASNSGPMTEPPASAEQGILSELLATDSFASAVVQNSLLGKSLGSANSIKDAPALLGTGQIVPTVTGNQVLQISYSASSPAMAKSVLAAVVAQLRDYTHRLTIQHNEAAVAYDSQQVKAAETAVATARNNVNAYTAGHPGVSQGDPEYGALVAAANNAAARLAQANTALAQVAGTGNAGWSVQVLDPPTTAGSAALSKKKIVEVLLGGAFGGLLVSFLAVVALTPAKKEVWEDELPLGGDSVPDVPPADPFRGGSPKVPTAPAQSTSAATAVRQPLLSLGDRRFQFRTPTAPTEEQ